jgi:hypothetical protein
VDVSCPDRVRLYRLLSHSVSVTYFYHNEEHSVPIQNLKITLYLPRAKSSKAKLYGEWIDPLTCKVLERISIPGGLEHLMYPIKN